MSSLREIVHTGSRTGSIARRWFTSDCMDLFVWQHTTGKLAAYQLCYNKRQDEKALIWSETNGYQHLGVDKGNNSGKYPRTPLYIADGDISPTIISAMLDNQAGELDDNLLETIKTSIHNFR